MSPQHQLPWRESAMNWPCFIWLKLWSFSSALGIGINISCRDVQCDHIDHSESETLDVNFQLLQLSNVLFRDTTVDKTTTSSVSTLESGEDQKRPWNFTEILKDEPQGSFLSYLDVLVHLVGLTYNTTSPISPTLQAPSNVTTRETWNRWIDLCSFHISCF